MQISHYHNFIDYWGHLADGFEVPLLLWLKECLKLFEDGKIFLLYVDNLNLISEQLQTAINITRLKACSSLQTPFTVQSIKRS